MYQPKFSAILGWMESALEFLSINSYDVNWLYKKHQRKHLTFWDLSPNEGIRGTNASTKKSFS